MDPNTPNPNQPIGEQPATTPAGGQPMGQTNPTPAGEPMGTPPAPAPAEPTTPTQPETTPEVPEEPEQPAGGQTPPAPAV